MRELKQLTASNVMVFMTDSTDHVTGKTGLTLTITASKDGAAFASITPTVTERGTGWYNIALTTAETDTLGDLALHITAAGADASDVLCRVVANIESDTYTRIGAPTGASVSADVATLLGKIIGTLATGTHSPQSGDAYSIANNGTYGNAALKTLIDTVDTVADAVKAKTDAIPAQPATEAKQDTIIGYIDTEVAAIKAKTDNLTFTGSDIKATLDGEKVTVTSNEDKTGYTIAAGGVPIGAFASGAITDAAIASDAETAIANAVKALTVDGYTWQQIMSVMLAVLAGVTGNNGLTIKNPAGSATRVTAVVDANNNRTSMTLNPGS